MKCPHCGRDTSKPDYYKRDREISRRYHDEDITVPQLGREFNLSPSRIIDIIVRLERERAQEAKTQATLLALRTYKGIEEIPLDVLDLSTRTINCFLNDNYSTVGEVMRLTDGELLCCPNFGRKSLNEWKLKLASLKRSFKRRLSSPNENNSSDVLGGVP